VYWFSWIFARTLFKILFGYKIVNIDRVPMEGPVILAANHQSYLDPPVLGVSVKRELHFFAKKELFDKFLLGWWVRKHNSIPVRRGVYDPASLSRAEEALEKGGGLIVFPEGTRGDGKTFLKPKPGIGLMARRSQVTIVPAYINGTKQLLRAMFRNPRISVTFGEPISSDEIEKFKDDKEGYRMLAAMVMDRITELKQEVIAG
jgi:1-acyl-sn-glycerol-3-phosphate acyltransferase